MKFIITTTRSVILYNFLFSLIHLKSSNKNFSLALNSLLWIEDVKGIKVTRSPVPYFWSLEKSLILSIGSTLSVFLIPGALPVFIVTFRLPMYTLGSFYRSSLLNTL